MRILSLAFDEIYIPRSHLLTSFHDGHRSILAGVLESEEFAWLSDRGVLLSSTSPSNDAIADTERIDTRSRNLAWLQPYASAIEQKLAGKVPALVVSSRSEALLSLPSYKEKAAALDRALKITGGPSLIASAEYRDTEFFHEMFLENLRSWDIPASVKDAYWRVTNEVYLQNVGNELGEIAVGYDPDVEPSVARRDLLNDLDTRLFTAGVVRSVIATVSSSRDLARWLRAPVARALAFRASEDRQEFVIWRAFQASYFDLLRAADKTIENLRVAEGFGEGDVRPIVSSEMTRVFDRFGSDAVSMFSQGVGGAAQVIDPSAGLGARALAAGSAGLLSRAVKVLIMAVRFPTIQLFVNSCLMPNRA